MNSYPYSSNGRSNNAAQRLLRLPMLGLCLLAATVASAEAATGALTQATPGTSSDKGDFQYSEPQPWPTQTLDLAPIAQQVSDSAREYCGSARAAAPLDMGETPGFMANLGKKAAGAVVGKLLGSVLGSSGGRKKPKLSRDPIKKKHKIKVKDATGKLSLQLGARQAEEELLVSTRVVKAPGKGTFHAIFLERPDCVRFFPVGYERYGLWGSWSLSVNVTKTTSRYRNGDLVSRDVSQRGWQSSGVFDGTQGLSLLHQAVTGDAKLLLNPANAYQAQLANELQSPAWQELGFNKPTQGIRSVGAKFAVTPSEITPGTIAVVHVTNLRNKRYTTLAVPVQLHADGERGVSLAALAP